MKKLIKYALISFVIIILIAMIGIIIFVKWVNPNNFKPIITDQIKKYTQLNAVIDGDLAWTFFPNIGIKAGRMRIDKIQIANTTIEVKLLPLLHKQIDISGIDVEGVNLENIQNASFHAKNVMLDKTFPVNVQLDYKMNKASAVHVVMTSEVIVDTAKQILVCHDLDGSIANTHLTGTATVTKLFSDPVLNGQFDIKSFDLKKLLQAIGESSDIIQSAKNGKASINVTASKKGVSAKGSVTIDAIQINHLRLSQLKLNSTFNKGILNLNPITATLYQGVLQSNVIIDITNTQPSYRINANLTNIQLAPLLRDVSGKEAKLSVEGTGNITFNATSSGTEPQVMMRRLNGGGQFNVVNGALIGVDLNTLIANASALAKKQPTKAANADKTTFTNLSGTATIRNGILENNNFILESSRFDTKGSGRVDFPSNWVNFLFHTTIKKEEPDQTDDWDNLFGIPVPIAVRGPLNNPSVSVDAGQLLAAIAKNQAKAQIKSQVKEQIKQVIPGPAGDVLQQLINR